MRKPYGNRKLTDDERAQLAHILTWGSRAEKRRAARLLGWNRRPKVRPVRPDGHPELGETIRRLWKARAKEIRRERSAAYKERYERSRRGWGCPKKLKERGFSRSTWPEGAPEVMG